MATSWFQPGDGFTDVVVWIVPGASRSGVVGLHDGAVRIRIAAPPEAGKANTTLERFLSKKSGSQCRIVKGMTGRRKTVRFATSDVASLASSLDLPYSD